MRRDGACSSAARIPLRPALHADEWPRLLKLTVPVALTLATGTLYVYLAQVVTDLVASEHESGLFAAAFRVFLVVAAVPGLVVSAAFPLLTRAARDDQERLAYALDRLFATIVVGGGLVALALAVGAPVALDVVAGAGLRRRGARAAPAGVGDAGLVRARARRVRAAVAAPAQGDRVRQPARARHQRRR